MEYEEKLTETNNKRKAKFGNDSKSSISSNGSTSSVFALRQKVTSLEHALAEKCASHTEETSGLYEQITKLNASFEKNEVQRQKLEYELALAQQKSNQNLRTYQLTDSQLKSDIENLREKLKSKEVFILHKENQFNLQYASLKDQCNTLAQDCRNKDTTISEMRNNNKAQKIETDRANAALKIEVEEKTSLSNQLKEQVKSQKESLTRIEADRELKNEEYTKSKEELLDELENSKRKFTNVNNSVQKLTLEKNALQVKQTNVEDLLAGEVLKYKECRTNLEEVSQQCRDLSNVLAQERELHSRLQAAHNKLREDYKQCNNELQHDRNEHKNTQYKITQDLHTKEKVISSVHEKIINYESELKELKEELSKAKTEQTRVEENNLQTLRSLKSILNNFRLVENISIPENFNDVIGCLSQTLEDYKTTKNNIQSKNSQLEIIISNLKEECSTYKQITENSDRALKEAEKLVTKAQASSTKSQATSAGLQEKVRQLHCELTQMASFTKEKDIKITSLNEQIGVLKLDYEQKEHASLNYLKNLFAICGKDSNGDMVKMREEITATLRDTVHLRKNLQEKEQDVLCKKEEIAQLKQSLQKLKELNSKVIMETEQGLLQGKGTWLKEKETLTEQFQAQHEKLKYAFENEVKKLRKKVEMKSSMADQLFTSQQSVTKLNEKCTELQIALKLLTCVISSLYAANCNLVTQKTLQNVSMERLTTFKENIALLNKTLESGMIDSTEQKIHSKRRHLILRFRVAVVAVVACNRLRVWQNRSNYMLCKYGVLRLPKEDLNSWLETDVEIAGAKRLVNQLNKRKQGDMRNSLKAFMDEYFENTHNNSDFNRGHEGLLFCTSKVLQKINARKQISSNNNMDLAKSLRSMFFDFTKRLHSSEVERKALKSSLDTLEFDRKHVLKDVEKYKVNCHKLKDKLYQERTDVARSNVQEKSLKEKIYSLEKELEYSVKVDHYEEVCNDLTAALKRGEDLQALFNKQAQQIEDMAKRIELHAQTFKKKDGEIKDIANELNMCQIKLSSSEHKNRDFHEALTKLKHERNRLTESLTKEKLKLEKMLREQEALMKYMRHVTTTLTESKQQARCGHTHPMNGDFADLPELILPQEVLGVEDETMSPEMQVAQNTVAMFISAQKESLNQIARLHAEKQAMRAKMTLLDNDVKAHRKHVRSLKDQISAVCQQQGPEMRGLNSNEGFVPLKSQR